MTATLPPEFHARIEALLAAGGRRLLGLVGPPGAGKSTVAEALLERYGAVAQVVPMDGFHLANAELARLGRAARKGASDTFDAAGYVALLKRLRTPAPNETVYAPAFRREIEEPIAGAIAVPPDTRLVITEGNYLLLDEPPWAEVATLLDDCWYIDVDDALRRQRLVARHMRHGRDAPAAQAWVEHTDEPNARRIAATRARAQAVLRRD